jgi:hypothetical protein
MNTNSQTIDLSWVTAAGGPTLHCENRRDVTGLPEEGWWVWRDIIDPCLNLHKPYTEPVSGINGTLIFNLYPPTAPDNQVTWESTFLFYTTASSGKKDKEVHHLPVRGSGFCETFDQAREAALAWRPAVEVIDGVVLWTDPETGAGCAELDAGPLTWNKRLDGYHWTWALRGLEGELQLMSRLMISRLSDISPSLAQMLIDAGARRKQLRAEMRKFLLNF